MTWVTWKNLELDVILIDKEVHAVFYSCPMDTEADIHQVLLNLDVNMEELKQLALDKEAQDNADNNYKQLKEDKNDYSGTNK